MDNNAASTPAASQASPVASTSAAAGSSTQPAGDNQTVDMIGVLGNLLKSQTGEQVSNERMAQILLTNMTSLVKQGKLNQSQILQLKQFADKHKTNAPGTPKASNLISVPYSLPASTTPTPNPATVAASTPNPAFKVQDTSASPPNLANSNPADYYPTISSIVNPTNPGAVTWPQTRPTLTGGLASGRMSGTPAQVKNVEDNPTLDDGRSRRKNTPGDQSMRRTIQDLVASVDPNVKIEPEVEDLLLSIADEFVDSVTNFACRLAKHRGSDSLEVRDLQLHLERNHNIRIPGFASDETRISLAQTGIAPAAPTAGGKKGTQGSHMTLRSQRLQQVAQAKRESKLM